MNKVQYKYRVSTPSNKLTLTYVIEQLSEVQIEQLGNFLELKQILNVVQSSREATIEDIRKMGAKVKELTVNSTGQKIALWCELFKQRYNLTYKVSTSEAAMMKNTDISVELVNLFFHLDEWWSKEKTLSRYARNINELKRIYAGKAKQNAGNNSSQSAGRSDLEAELRRRYGNK